MTRRARRSTLRVMFLSSLAGLVTLLLEFRCPALPYTTGRMTLLNRALGLTQPRLPFARIRVLEEK